MCVFLMSSYKVLAVSIPRRGKASRIWKSLKKIGRRSSSVRTSRSEGPTRSSRRSIFRSKRINTAQVRNLADFLDRYSVPEDLTLDRVIFKMDRKSDPIRLFNINWSKNQAKLESLSLMLHINHAVKKLFKGQAHQYDRHQLSLDEVHNMPQWVGDLFREKTYLNMLTEIKDKGLFSIYVNKGFFSKPRAAAKSIREKMARSKSLKRSNTGTQPVRSVSPFVTVSKKFELTKLEEDFPEFVYEYEYNKIAYRYLSICKEYTKLKALSSPSPLEKQRLEEYRQLESVFIEKKLKYQATLDQPLVEFKLSELNNFSKAFESMDNEISFILKTPAYRDLQLQDSQYTLLKDCLLINRELTTDRYKLTLNEADFYSKMYPDHFSVKHYLDLITTIETRFHLFVLYSQRIVEFEEHASYVSDYKTTIGALDKYASEISSGAPKLVRAWLPSAKLIEPTPTMPNLSPASSLESIHSEEGDPVDLEEKLQLRSARSLESIHAEPMPDLIEVEVHTPKRSTNPFFSASPFSEDQSLGPDLSPLVNKLFNRCSDLPLVVSYSPDVGTNSPTVHSPFITEDTNDVGSPKSRKSRRRVPGSTHNPLAKALFRPSAFENSNYDFTKPVDPSVKAGIQARRLERQKTFNKGVKVVRGAAVTIGTVKDDRHMSPRRRAAAKESFRKAFNLPDVDSNI